MFGFNVNGGDVTSVPGDNRPVVPLAHRTFSQWWGHGLLDHPPVNDTVMQLPVGQTTNVELACDKGATSYWKSSAGTTYLQDPNGDQNYPCPGAPLSQFHTNGLNDLGGCALGVSYKSNAMDVQPNDYTIFSVQHQCVWTRWTAFDVPAAMPPCPNDKCMCSWFWIHEADSGSEQMYMTTFQCNFPGATSTVPVAQGKVPRRCGADPIRGKLTADLSNCTTGAKLPMYWLQAEGNNMFEDPMTPPVYNDLYGFSNGAQHDIFATTDAPPTSTVPPTNPHNQTNSSPQPANPSLNCARKRSNDFGTADIKALLTKRSLRHAGHHVRNKRSTLGHRTP
ncbi:hypothetical protein BS47DRAFT_1119465 [Hydnum rufescens UP504]|uniref:Uncharacterized protein n=1 Tax=Hydnum rufescens UP504 TaxID=1448309 RepID=A0A9P6AU04_9AGAM|nr:hypothetical protein BS47DRAFT_1119465 [Hydnum rufescens UP504]